MSSLNAWLRRLLYLILVLIWIVLILFPMGAFLLAARGELQLGDDPQNHLRLFLLQEDAAQGVVVESVRPSRTISGCHQSRITYLLWEGDGENVLFCRCTDPKSGDLMPADLQACTVP